MMWKMRILIIVGVSLICIGIGAMLFEVLPFGGSSWRGITIGVSTKGDVVRLLGKPNHIQHNLLSTSYYYVEERPKNTPHLIVIIFGVVRRIEESPMQYSEGLKLNDLIEKYGLPDLVEWSFEGPGRRTVVFSRYGVIANVTAAKKDEAMVSKVIYYKTSHPLLLLIRFANVMSPIDPYPDSDIIGPKDPWFGTSKVCRADCD